MSKLKFLHAADFHLDSPFEGLSAGKAVVRREEQRDLLKRLTAIAQQEHIDLVLLSGDLLDTGTAYYETGESLLSFLEELKVPVFIAPGNHDYYTPQSPYARLQFPKNVHIFTKSRIESVDLPALGVRVYGGAFTDSRCPSLLSGFHAEQLPGIRNLLCMHSNVGSAASIYNPVTVRDLEHSGLDYAAFGHIHHASGLLQAGKTFYSWPGCPEGRGFDELGSCFVNLVEFTDDNQCQLRQIETSYRKYYSLEVNVTDQEPLLAIHAALPDDTSRHIYRISLTGETESAPNLAYLQKNLEELFFALQLKDDTRIAESIWTHCGEDTLRGLFLTRMQQRYVQSSEADRPRIEQAVRWGLAALDNREEVTTCEDS